MLQSMWSQRVGHDWATQQQQVDLHRKIFLKLLLKEKARISKCVNVAKKVQELYRNGNQFSYDSSAYGNGSCHVLPLTIIIKKKTQTNRKSLLRELSYP